MWSPPMARGYWRPHSTDQPIFAFSTRPTRPLRRALCRSWKRPPHNMGDPSCATCRPATVSRNRGRSKSGFRAGQRELAAAAEIARNLHPGEPRPIAAQKTQARFRLHFEREIVVKVYDIYADVAPHAKDNYTSGLKLAEPQFSRFNITGSLRISHFLAQVLYETGAGQVLFENMS